MALITKDNIKKIDKDRNCVHIKVAGVANVLSTINGTPWACAAFANFSISNTVSAGLAIVSPKTAFVFG